MTIAEPLKSERKALETCIREFAVQVGIRANAQSNYERGVRSPRADYLNVLHHLDMDVPYILLGIRTKQMFTSRRKVIH